MIKYKETLIHPIVFTQRVWRDGKKIFNKILTKEKNDFFRNFWLIFRLETKTNYSWQSEIPATFLLEISTQYLTRNTLPIDDVLIFFFHLSFEKWNV